MPFQMSRRVLLQNGLLTVGARMAVPGIFSALAASVPSLDAAAQAASTGGKILVVVQIAGA
jgi:hypothetical protein